MSLPDFIIAACGTRVALTSATKEHLRAHPEAKDLLEEAMGMVTMPTEATFLPPHTVDFGRIIGTNACVKAADTETLHFAVRAGREVPSRVLPGQEPEPTSQFTMIAYKGDGGWVLITGFAGPSAPREPHDRYFQDKRDGDEFAASVEFWTEHGLVLGDDWGEVYTSTWQAELDKLS